jgi:hypothetical protein
MQKGATPQHGKPWNTVGSLAVAPDRKCLILLNCGSPPLGTIFLKCTPA